jgi:putative copper resistance protein D
VDAAHLLGAGAWLGALIPIGLLARGSLAGGIEPEVAGRSIARFSPVGMAAVAVLAGSGLFNAVILVGSFPAMVESAYGFVLSVKLVLFSIMLAMAWMNRRLARAAATADLPSLGRLGRNVAFEQALGVGVLALVGALGMMSPPT